MLFFASHADEQPGRTPADLAADPVLAPYVAGWGRPGDLGVVAVEDGHEVGAAWVRLPWPALRSTPVFVDDETPELAIAVVPGRVGHGIGNAVLGELLALADGRYPAVVLTVRAGNPARRLYERHGFVEVGEIENRIGTRSAKMLRRTSAG
jgi:ribosomal protein S18 acetylase RimI-like enzyme